MITTIHHNLFGNVSKSILKSIIGSLNATSIAYARGHLRFNAIENIAANRSGRTLQDVPTIDDYNDAHAAVDESNNRAGAGADMGFAVQMQAGELAERLMCMRNYFAGLLDQMKENVNDVPLTIAETVKFQMDRQPDNNETLIEALALSVDLDPAMLKAAKIKMQESDASDLRENAGKIISYLESFQGEQFDQDEAEDNFAALPAHVQYKLMAAVLRSYSKASEKAMMSLLRGRIDAAADIKMLNALRDTMRIELRVFSRMHRIELDAYMERGGQLPELEDRELVTDNAPRTEREQVVVGAAAQRTAIATDAAHARAEEDAKAADKKSKLRRVPKQTV